MEYSTGDILKAEVNNPFVYHYGIVIIKDGQIEVVHNAAKKKNNHGGNIVSESLKDFLKTRRIVHVQRTKIKRDRIIKMIDKYKSIPFNIFTFNCEQFIFEIRDGTPSSQQLRQGLFNIVTFFVIASMLWKRMMPARKTLFPVKI